jgi:hypothetical protein
MIFRRTALKLSTTILLLSLVLVTLGLFASNLILRSEYNKLDKKDKFWNYTTILNQPFKHVKINGGNTTNIVFEPSQSTSVRVIKYWEEKNKGSVKTTIKDDTLYISFTDKVNKPDNKYEIDGADLVHISAPQLLSVDGNNTNIQLQSIKQSSLSINAKGKSEIIIESAINNFDNLYITQSDSSKIALEMSPEFKGSRIINIQHLKADLFNYAQLDIGNGYVNDLKLNIADGSSIILSGKSLGHLNK